MRLPETEGRKPQSVSTVKLKHFRSEKFRCAFSVKKTGGVAAPQKISLQKAQHTGSFRKNVKSKLFVKISIFTKNPFSQLF